MTPYNELSPEQKKKLSNGFNPGMLLFSPIRLFYMRQYLLAFLSMIPYVGLLVNIYLSITRKKLFYEHTTINNHNMIIKKLLSLRMQGWRIINIVFIGLFLAFLISTFLNDQNNLKDYFFGIFSGLIFCLPFLILNNKIILHSFAKNRNIKISYSNMKKHREKKYEGIFHI